MNTPLGDGGGWVKGHISPWESAVPTDQEYPASTETDRPPAEPDQPTLQNRTSSVGTSTLNPDIPPTPPNTPRTLSQNHIVHTGDEEAHSSQAQAITEKGTAVLSKDATLQKALNFVQGRREQNLSSITKFRADQGKTTEGDIEVDQMTNDIEKIRKTARKPLKRFQLWNLKRKARKSESGALHLKKAEVMKRFGKEYGLTITRDGKVFVHVPKSTFARGGKRRLKSLLNCFHKKLLRVLLNTIRITPPK